MHTISQIYILLSNNICEHTIITTRWQTSLSLSSQLQWTCQSQSHSKRWRCVPVDVTSQLHLKTPELCSDRHHSVLFCSFLWRSSKGDFLSFISVVFGVFSPLWVFWCNAGVNWKNLTCCSSSHAFCCSIWPDACKSALWKTNWFIKYWLSISVSSLISASVIATIYQTRTVMPTKPNVVWNAEVICRLIELPCGERNVCVIVWLS